MKHIWKFIAIVQTILLAFTSGVMASTSVWKWAGNGYEKTYKENKYRKSYRSYYDREE